MTSAAETAQRAPQRGEAARLQARSADLEQHRLAPHGGFPNNPHLPVLVYRQGFRSEVTAPAGTEVALPTYETAEALAQRIEDTFAAHAWTNCWRDVVYEVAHYHGSAHEALGCYRGRARIQLGGPSGPACELKPGDVLVLPAGTGHRCVERSRDFRVVGAYAAGRAYDMRYGKADERPEVDLAIERVPLPEQDPVFGVGGPLIERWRKPS